ncbi:MAG: ABC transporter substrate-binding protein [Propionibacteriaceae bacterium]|nr:ABC transporter substrate-binding protein [Propionibacteriaceae bacterium]
MKIMTRVLGVGIALALAFAVTSCSTTDDNGGATGTGSVYFLNFKPEVADVYTEIVAAYKEETGVDVKVVTAASGTYEQTLTSEIAKSSPPTIFQINGPIGYSNWKDYTADVKDSQLYAHLADQSLAITSGDGVFGIPYVVEAYGIIYNNAIMKAYFAMADKAVSINSVEEIVTFDLLKAVVEDMTAKKDALGITGVFSNTSLKPGQDWRWQTHLANVPFYYEFTKNKVDLSEGVTPPTVTFEYGDNMQMLFDLYLNNSTTDKTQLGAKTVDESMAEFALGQSAMVQNGTWAWKQISDVQGNTVLAEDVGFLPMYIGVTGEEKQGLAIGTENYFSINSKVSKADQQASLDFLWWLFSSEKGKAFVANDLGLNAPFDTFTAAETPSDPLAQSVQVWMNKDGVTSVSWDAMLIFPSQDWKDGFGADLLSYAQGKMTWEQVSEDVISTWEAQAR